MGLDSHFSRTVVLNSSQKKNLEHEDEKMTTPANCLFVVIAMVIVVGILMLGFYFRYIMGNIEICILVLYIIHHLSAGFFPVSFASDNLTSNAG